MTEVVEDDGMQHDSESIRIEAMTLDADYQGWRIRFKGAPGNARVVMQVDVGVGDAVYPKPPREAMQVRIQQR